MKKLTAILFLLLSLAAHAQAPQSTTSIPQPADVQLNNGIGNGYRVTKATGLTVNVAKGSVQCLDQWIDYGGGTKTVTDNAVSYIVLDPAQNCAPVVVSTLSQGTWWLAKVTAASGAVTAITYAHMVPQISRVAINGAGGTGGGTSNQGTVALSGCGVNWTGGLNFTVSSCTYLIAGTQYSSGQTDLTLTTADATNPRIDVIAVDNTGTAVVITGTPAGSPAEPSVDPASQLRLIAVSIPALATTPSGISKTDLYLENTEWTCAPSSNFNCGSTSNPFAGSDDIEATSGVAGNNVTLTKPSGTVDLSTYANLVLYVRSKAAWANAKSLSIFWLNGSTVVGASVSIKTGNFGFSSSVTGTYQQITIPLGSFATGTNPVNKLKISVAGGGGSIGFYADNISIQSGVTNSGGGPQTFTVTPTSPLSGGGTAPLGGVVNISLPGDGNAADCLLGTGVYGSCSTAAGGVTSFNLRTGAITFLASDLPNPSASTLGGIESLAAVSHKFIDSISTLGVPHASQPAYSDLTGTPTLAQTLANATNKWLNSYDASTGLFTQTQPDFSNLSGSVAASQLPNPSASTLGGIESLALVSHKFIDSISTLGVPHASQPASTDLSDYGSIPNAALLNPSLTFNGQSVALGAAGNVNNGATTHSIALNQGNGSALTGLTLGAHQTPIGASSADPSAKTIPDCTDSAGNHLNFTQSSDAFSCGTSAPGVTRGIPFTIGTPGGTALTAGASDVDYITVPFACTIAGYNLVIDAGTITVKFWKKATGTAIPTSSDSISTSGVGISSGTAIHSSTTSDFTTTTVTANDIMAMKITDVSSAAYVQGVIPCTQ
jgi:hypothetical protein